MKELTVEARMEHLEDVQQFIRQQLQPYRCPERELFQIELAVEELFANIVRYAYHPNTGAVCVGCAIREDPLCLTVRFADSGTPFDPLAREDADTSPQALRQREGGLGILLVKKIMDEVAYGYENGRNTLTVRKLLCADPQG